MIYDFDDLNQAFNAETWLMENYACEFYTKFAGTTEEFLIFRSDLYQRGVGLPIGRLMNISPEMYNSTTITPSFSTTGYSGGAAPVDNGANVNF
jgi:hypothetical protein